MWKLFKQTIDISFYASLIPIIFIFIIAYAFIGLYSVVGQSPIITLRLIIVATSLVFLFLSSYTFYFQKINVYSRGIILVSWILSLLFVPFFRSSIIKLLSRRRLWGEEVIIIGLNNRTEKLIQLLFSQPEFGLIPVFILDFSSYKSNEKPILQIPIFNISEDIDFNLLRQSSKIETAIIISDNSDQKIVRNFIKN